LQPIELNKRIDILDYLRRFSLFGIVHALFHPGEALMIYAVYGLLIIPFNKMKKEFNLIIGLVLLIGTSYISVKVLIPLQRNLM